MFLGKKSSNTLQKHLKHLLSFQLSSPTFGPRTWHPPFPKKTLRPPKEVQAIFGVNSPNPNFLLKLESTNFRLLVECGWRHLTTTMAAPARKKSVLMDAASKLPDYIARLVCVCVSCLGMIRRFFQNRFALNGKSSDLFL